MQSLKRIGQKALRLAAYLVDRWVATMVATMVAERADMWVVLLVESSVDWKDVSLVDVKGSLWA